MTLQSLSAAAKKLRGFNAQTYIAAKVAAINAFFREENLNTAVLGLSGGVDSAVVLGLLVKAREQSDSPLQKIWPIAIPIESKGATGQQDALDQAYNVAFALGVPCYTADATRGCQNIIEDSHRYSGSWETGQLVALMRTPVLYYHAALLQSMGYRSLVLGTTNRSEGSYIGFFGKQSDAAVDLQIISDLYKSEVYEVAKLLGVPDSVITRAPRGDVWNGQTSEELMGFSYEFLEIYLMVKEFNLEIDLTGDEKALYERDAKRVEAWHSKNSHKYKNSGCGFARFIDVMPRKIPGGWW